MYKNILTVSILLLLAGCGKEEVNHPDEPAPNNYTQVEEIEENQEEESFEEATENIDLEDGLEDINWEDVHLTKAQFDEFLNEMLNNSFEADNLKEEESDDFEDFELEIKDIRFDEKTIEYTLSSIDEDNLGALFSQMMFVTIIDGYTRQFYLHSDYSIDNQQPTIIFVEEDGRFITENDDFIQFEE